MPTFPHRPRRPRPPRRARPRRRTPPLAAAPPHPALWVWLRPALVLALLRPGARGMSARVLDTLLPRLRHEPTRQAGARDAGRRGRPRQHPRRPRVGAAAHHPRLRRAARRPAGRSSCPRPRRRARAARLHARRTAQRILDPSVPFAVHSTDGEPLEPPRRRPDARRRRVPAGRPRPRRARAARRRRLRRMARGGRAGARPARDPFHRLEILPSSRTVRIELDGVVLAESARAQLLFEGTVLPRPRLPAAARTSASRCSPAPPARAARTRARRRTGPSTCGAAPSPTSPGATRPRARRPRALAGLVAFFDERVDVELDGEVAERPRTPWS